MFDISNDHPDFPVYYYGLATGPFSKATDYTGKGSQANQMLARERSIPQIFNLAKYLQQEMPLTLNEIALVLFYVRSARNDGQFLDAPTCEYRMEIAQANPALVLDAVAQGLNTLSQRAPGQGWRVTSGILQSPHRPDAFVLQAGCSYEWAPAGVGYGGITQALMNLTCTAALQANSVSLVLAFDDQPAWLFRQSQIQAQNAINAVTNALAFNGLPAQNVVSGLLTPHQALLTFMIVHLKQTPPGA